MNIIHWFFIQWYFIIVNSTPVPDVTIVLQKRPYSTAYEITSVLTAKHLNSGIAWIQPFRVEREGAKTHVSKYVPAFQEEQNCKIDSDLHCTSYWTNKTNWKLKKSHFTNLDIVTDNRWEEFKILYTDGETKFYPVDEFLNHKNKLTFHFSIRIEKDAHIFLCEDSYVPTSKCYWISLGGNSGTQTALRKCMENEIQSSLDAPLGLCANFQASIRVFPEEYLGVHSWKHFTISINENNIVLKSASNDYILLNYTDNKNNYINIRHLHVRSAQVPAYWKFHTYEFTYTTDVTEEVLGPRIKIQDNKSCISFYAAMCLQCSLSIETLSIQNDKGSVISKKQILPQKEFKWQEVKLSTSYTYTISEIQLYIHTQCYNNCDEQFWAIDNFRLCADDEVRVLNVDGSILQTSFQIVDGTFSNLQIRAPTSTPIGATKFSDVKCPIGSIGSTSCRTYAQALGSRRPFCNNSIICDYSYSEEGFCRYSPGYTGVVCESACDLSFYGYDCKERCGLYEYAPCDYITGICSNNSCLSQLTDPPCKTQSNVLKFDIYEVSEDMLRLRIVPEYPPTGELDQYFVSYCIYSSDRGSFSNCIEKYFEPESCKIWRNYNCIDISENLKRQTLYRVFIQARNKNVTQLGGKASQNVVTEQRESQSPEKLSYSWDNFYNLTLQWNHPNTTNGPLTKFIITIAKDNNRKSCYTYDYMVTEENETLTYNYKVPIENSGCYTSLLTATIQSYNIMAGASININMYSPPEMPALNNEPFVEYVSNTSFTISSLSVKKTMLQKSFMYIVLSESQSKFEIDDFKDSLNKLENLKTLSPSWLIGKYNLIEEIPLEKLTIGSNKSGDSLQDDTASNRITLSPGTSYTITILMYNEYQERKRYRVYEIVTSTSRTTISNDSSNLALIALIPLFLLPLLLWIYIRKRKTGRCCSIIYRAPSMRFAFKARIRGNPDVIPLTKNLRVSTTEIIAPPQIPLKNISNNIDVIKVEDNKINNEYSKPIKVTDFDKYVKDAILNGELGRQHSLFVRGQTKPWDYGALPQNKSKNRYNNLIAYDHTRVQLEKINNDPYSDYINANYIEGYKTKKAYIATQGPKVSTINDFWRMIWQDNVKHIVMLANVIEGGKKRAEQYWPNINETSQFGNISVKYISTVVSADYEYRTFLMTSSNTERKIEQLHFTSWPDHGVPMYSQSLVPLFRKLLTIPHGNSPIVVHCSAGVGRTGIVILCDLCLRMSAHEGVIDALKHQRKIREQRANLVDNLEQYKLVHLVLLECLINPDTSITCDEDAEKNILKLLETDKLEKQFRFIREIAWQDQVMRPIMEMEQKSEFKQKNRVEAIFASGYGRVYLSLYPVTDEHSDYINAVEVDGFKAPKRFIATQQPLPNTISDFWRMIDEKEVSTIVSLNSINKENNKSCIFWPTSKVSEMYPVPYLLIKFISKIGDEEITIVNLELHNRKHKDHTKRDIKLIKLKGWPADQLIPKENVLLIKLWNETEKVSKGEHPIVVTCHEGATACGLFLALTFVIERIKLEHQCDVCLAVRTVRHNREQFVKELDQFNYLYRAAITYLSCLELLC